MFAALHSLRTKGKLPSSSEIAKRLTKFLVVVDSAEERARFAPAEGYYLASRSASNDPGARHNRINTVIDVISNRLKYPSS
jgi:hypothetical protein